MLPIVIIQFFMFKQARLCVRFPCCHLQIMLELDQSHRWFPDGCKGRKMFFKKFTCMSE